MSAARPGFDRRRLLALLSSGAAFVALGSRGRADPLDRGIGGTGVAPPTDESDRGIGGTGVIGTIRKFGSIIVNDMRIAYDKDVAVRIDGRPASATDLALGQVVRVRAVGKSGALSTQLIDVTHEVVGPVERSGAKDMTVLGQKVDTRALPSAAFKTGDVVAVSGLRRNDGTIVASRVQASPGAPNRLRGPLVQGRDGTARIGGLAISGVDPSLVGQRVVVDGGVRGAGFVATRGVAETSLWPRSVRSFSIESYVERSGDTLRLGSGLQVSRNAAIDIPAGRSVRAILQTSVGPGGRLTVESARSDERASGAPQRGGTGGPGSGGGGGSGPGRGGPDKGGRTDGGAGGRGAGRAGGGQTGAPNIYKGPTDFRDGPGGLNGPTLGQPRSTGRPSIFDGPATPNGGGGPGGRGYGGPSSGGYGGGRGSPSGGGGGYPGAGVPGGGVPGGGYPGGFPSGGGYPGGGAYPGGGGYGNPGGGGFGGGGPGGGFGGGPGGGGPGGGGPGGGPGGGSGGGPGGGGFGGGGPGGGFGGGGPGGPGGGRH